MLNDATNRRLTVVAIEVFGRRNAGFGLQPAGAATVQSHGNPWA